MSLPPCAACGHPQTEHHVWDTSRPDLTVCHRLGNQWAPLCHCMRYIGPDKADAYRIAAAYFGRSL